MSSSPEPIAQDTVLNRLHHDFVSWVNKNRALAALLALIALAYGWHRWDIWRHARELELRCQQAKLLDPARSTRAPADLAVFYFDEPFVYTGSLGELLSDPRFKRVIMSNSESKAEDIKAALPPERYPFLAVSPLVSGQCPAGHVVVTTFKYLTGGDPYCVKGLEVAPTTFYGFHSPARVDRATRPCTRIQLLQSYRVDSPDGVLIEQASNYSLHCVGFYRIERFSPVGSSTLMECPGFENVLGGSGLFIRMQEANK